MLRKLVLLLIVAIVFVLCFPSSAFAADGNGDGYDDNDFDKLQAFLNQPSAISGQTNGQSLNPAYDPADPATWTGVVWNSDASMRVTSIGEDYSWQYKSFAGTLDLSGFTSLEYMNCAGFNALTALNVTGCPALRTMYCFDSGLSTLDINTNAQLETLHCSDNPLGDLDVSANTLLRNLYCQNTQLSTLDVSALNILYYLDCSRNAIATLDTGANPALGYFFCNNNLLTTLDASANTALVYLDFSGNRLTRIDANVGGKAITLRANRGGYVGLSGSIDESVLNAIGQPAADTVFYRWTASGAPVSTDAAYPLTEAGYDLLANFAYTVTYNLNGGGSGPAPVAVQCGEAIAVPPADPVRTGYSFEGWYKESACTNPWNFAGDTVESNTTLFAKWRLILAVAGPSGSTGSATIYEGGRITLTPNIPGGTWDYPRDVLSAVITANSAVFTGLKTGTARVTYSADGQVTTYDIEIDEAELPATGQSFSPVIWLLALAGCTGGTAIWLLVRRKRRRA